MLKRVRLIVMYKSWVDGLLLYFLLKLDAKFLLPSFYSMPQETQHVTNRKEEI